MNIFTTGDSKKVSLAKVIIFKEKVLEISDPIIPGVNDSGPQTVDLIPIFSRHGTLLQAPLM